MSERRDDGHAASSSAPPPAAFARLVHLLHVRAVDAASRRYEVATDGAIALARTLGPDGAAAAVTWVLERYEPGRGDHRVAERAADVAARLRLVGAAPALVACMERLSEYDAVAHAAVRALEALGAAAAGPLLAAFARCPTVEDRLLIGHALSQTPPGDPRVRAALEGLLAEAPERGAGLLGRHGDRAALPALAAALDALALPPEQSPGELARLERIVAVAHAMMALKGKLTPAQQGKFESAYARSDDLILGGAGWEEPVAVEKPRP